MRVCVSVCVCVCVCVDRRVLFINEENIFENNLKELLFVMASSSFFCREQINLVAHALYRMLL